MFNIRSLKCLSFIYLLTTASWAADAASSVVAAGYQIPTPVSVAPGQIITFFVHGVGAGLTGPVHATTTPLPTLLAGISAMVVGINLAQPVPILAVEPIPTCGDVTQVGCGAYTAITVQMPFQIPAENPGAATGAPPAGLQLALSENGAAAATVDLISWVDQIHLLRTCDVLYKPRGLGCHPWQRMLMARS